MNESVARNSGQETIGDRTRIGRGTKHYAKRAWRVDMEGLGSHECDAGHGRAVVAQAQPRQNRGRVRNQGGAPLKKARPEAADPLAKVADVKGKAAATGSFHYTFKLHSFDGTPLAASFYPSKLG